MNRSNQKSVFFVLMLLLGMLMVFQFKTLESGVKYLSIKDMYAYSIELESHKSEIELLDQQLKELQAQVDAYSLAKEDDQIDYEAFLKSELEMVKMTAGLTRVEGPGVVILVTDGTRELNADENPNNLLVHDLDIRAMVDDLRNAGAEAIAINGQRVVFNKSQIVCTGPTIKINDQVFAPPYVIEAIGDRKIGRASCMERV